MKPISNEVCDRIMAKTITILSLAMAGEPKKECGFCCHISCEIRAFSARVPSSRI
jgi:hypothetical protein